MSLLKRNNTSFPIKLNARLKKLYEDYKKDPDIQKLLYYYQYIPRCLFSQIDGTRGILIYASPGLGKTRMALSIAAEVDSENIIVLEPHGLHSNMKHNKKIWEDTTGDKIKLKYVSSNAYNAGFQFEKLNLNNSMLIVDEAHNLFKAIINSGDRTNARRIYDHIMGAKNLKILFLTGTPISKDPFELVPCFNMLAGYDLLPTNYETFYHLYVDEKENKIKNKEKFENRILGMVSHVDQEKPTGPGDAIKLKPRDDGWFPEDLGISIDRIEMGEQQYRQYLLYRHKEDESNKTASTKKKATKNLSIPSKSVNQSYYVGSRTCSDFYVPPGYEDYKVQDMPNEVFIKQHSPKIHMIAEGIAKCKGKSIAYSQFVEKGLNVLGRFLELQGFEMLDLSTVDPSIYTDADANASNDVSTNVSNNESIDVSNNDADVDINDVIEEVEGSGEKKKKKKKTKKLNQTYISEIPEDDLELRELTKQNTMENSKVLIDDVKLTPEQIAENQENHKKNNEEIRKFMKDLNKGNVKRYIYNPYAKKVRFEKNYCDNSPEIRNPMYIEKEREIIREVVKERDPKLIKYYTRDLTYPEGFTYREHKHEYAGKIGMSKEDDEKFTKLHNFSLHHGQRKLFITELDLLTRAFESNLQKSSVLYIGSAPCIHLSFLASLFPNVDWTLVDPNPFYDIARNYKNITGNEARPDQFVLINDFFTDELALSFKDKFDFFLSDIRLSLDDVEPGGEEHEKNINYDMQKQAEWTRIVNPKIACMLKFRLPFLSNYVEQKYKRYMKGEVLLQDWAPKSSTESRLVAWAKENPGYVEEEYFHLNHYENWQAYKNQILRRWVTYLPELNGKETSVRGFDRCYDCAFEYTSWQDFIHRFNYHIEGIPNEYELIQYLMNALGYYVHQALQLRYPGAPEDFIPKSIHGEMQELPMCKKTDRLYMKYVEPIIAKYSTAVKGGASIRTNEGDEIAKARNGTYVILSGDVSEEDREKIKRIFNSPQNKYGEILKAILMSEVGIAGLDLKCTLEAWQVEPPWDMTRTKQFFKRAIRIGSHDMLPPEEREVKCHICISSANILVKDQMIEKEDKTIDERFYENALRKGKLIDQFLGTLSDVCFECSQFGYHNCRVCASTDKALFGSDPARDVQLEDPCTPINADIKVNVKKIIHGDKVYYYAENPESLNGYDIYEFDEEHGGYVKIDSMP